MSQVSCEQEKTLGPRQLSSTCILPRSCCSARMQAGEPTFQSSFDSDPVDEFVFSGSIYPLLRFKDAQGFIWVTWRHVCLDFGGVKI